MYPVVFTLTIIILFTVPEASQMNVLHRSNIQETIGIGRLKNSENTREIVQTMKSQQWNINVWIYAAKQYRKLYKQSNQHYTHGGGVMINLFTKFADKVVWKKNVEVDQIARFFEHLIGITSPNELRAGFDEIYGIWMLDHYPLIDKNQAYSVIMNIYFARNYKDLEKRLDSLLLEFESRSDLIWMYHVGARRCRQFHHCSVVKLMNRLMTKMNPLQWAMLSIDDIDNIVNNMNKELLQKPLDLFQRIKGIYEKCEYHGNPLPMEYVLSRAALLHKQCLQLGQHAEAMRLAQVVSEFDKHRSVI